MKIYDRHNRTLRDGFTLIELLVVVSIIAFLASLSVMVLNGLTDQANEEATVSTIRKLNGLLEKRIEAFNKAIGRDGSFKKRYVAAARNLLIQDRIYGPLIGTAGNSDGDSAIVEALARKVAMRHLFPQRHEDLLLLDFLGNGVTSVTDFFSDNSLKAIPADPNNIDRENERSVDVNGNRISDTIERVAADVASLHQRYPPGGDNSGDYIDDATVSAELLYFFLVHSDSLGSSEAITDQFTESEIADTDNDGLLEFVDAWGNPLRFYRWPTRLIDTDAPSPFQPVLNNTSDDTDVPLTVPPPVPPPVLRVITANERLLANIMFKGLAPPPTLVPTGRVDLNGDGDTDDAGESGTMLPRDILLVDPDDPVGVLYRGLEQYTGGAIDLNGDSDTDDPGENDTGVPLRTEYNETNYHTPDTYHAPLIVSAGADELLGLYEPSDTPNLGNLAAYDTSVDFEVMLEQISDNLTNRNRRAGGR